MEIDLNNAGRNIEGIAWRIKNRIIDDLRKLHHSYDCCDNDDLEQIEKDLLDEAEKLDFIGGILADGTNENEK